VIVRVRSVLLIAAIGLLFVGCGGSRAGGSPVATNSVDLPPSYRFAPPDITVASGTTVTWTNHDNFTHSVQFTDGGLPNDPQLMEPGKTTQFTFKTAGTFHYQCSLHPQNMKGSVTVTP